MVQMKSEQATRLSVMSLAGVGGSGGLRCGGRGKESKIRKAQPWRDCVAEPRASLTLCNSSLPHFTSFIVQRRLHIRTDTGHRSLYSFTDSYLHRRGFVLISHDSSTYLTTINDLCDLPSPPLLGQSHRVDFRLILPMQIA